MRIFFVPKTRYLFILQEEFLYFFYKKAGFFIHYLEMQDNYLSEMHR